MSRRAKRRPWRAMRMFHVTTLERAKAILRKGFLNNRESYLTRNTYSGVWLSDKPLSVNEGTKGSTVLAVDFAVRPRLEQYEWIEEGKSYREWLVPAALVNKNARIILFEEGLVEDEFDDCVDNFTSLAKVVLLLLPSRHQKYASELLSQNRFARYASKAWGRVPLATRKEILLEIHMKENE